MMSLPHAILALLYQQPKQSGYDLMKDFNEAMGQFWNASHQQIYRELAKMVDKSWLELEQVPQAGKPDKKLYQLTAKGAEALIQWLKQPVKTAPVREELLIKIYAGHLLPPGELLAHVCQEQAVYREKLAVYEHIEQTHFSAPQTLSYAHKLLYMTLRAGIAHMQGGLNWMAEAEAVIREEIARANAV